MEPGQQRIQYIPFDLFMKRSGFTFIEIIVSITIFTVIIVSVYSVFYMGIKTWRRNQEERSLQKIRMAFLKIEKELKRTFFFSAVPFKGTPKEVLFPLSVSDLDSDTEKLYVVTYAINRDEHLGLEGLQRKESVFSEDPGDFEEKKKNLLSLMEEIRFEYASTSGDSSKTLAWQDEWDSAAEDSLPSGVRISLEVDTPQEVYNKVVLLEQGDF